MPVPFVCGLLRKGDLLFTKARNLHIDVRFKLGLDFEAFYHLDNLDLFLSSAAVSGADFL